MRRPEPIEVFAGLGVILAVCIALLFVQSIHERREFSNIISENTNFMSWVKFEWEKWFNNPRVETKTIIDKTSEVAVGVNSKSTYDCSVNPAQYGYKGKFAANICGEWKYFVDGHEVSQLIYSIRPE